MQAVEDEPIASDSALVGHWRAQGRIQVFTPTPLGEQRQRFMALVEDMRRHGADYIGQLGMLTLAGLNRMDDQRESSQALVADLLRRTDIRERNEEQLLLWQSRLMLKLGEWYDQQQADLSTALDRIAARQDALFQGLRDEENSPFSLGAELAESSRESEPLLRHRLKAWCRLSLHGQGEVPGIPITRHATAMELLREVHEKQQRTPNPASTVAILELPTLLRDMTGDDQTDRPLIEQCPELQQAVEQMAGPVAEDQAKAIKELCAAKNNPWHHLLDRNFPTGSSGRCRLELVYFPEISSRQLLLEAFAGGMRSGGQEKTRPRRGCCLGVLREF
ncbi:hypothetical protein [Desulfobulbus propionicus]